MAVAAATRAAGDSAHCGDQTGIWVRDRSITLCMVDGLGRGEEAEIAAKAAVRYVADHLDRPLPEIFKSCDKVLRKTRGVVMGLAVIDQKTGELRYSGVGNTSISMHGSRVKKLPSSRGIVGGGFKSLSVETATLVVGEIVMLHTDGLNPDIQLDSNMAVPTAALGKLVEDIMEHERRPLDDAALILYHME